MTADCDVPRQVVGLNSSATRYIGHSAGNPQRGKPAVLAELDALGFHETAAELNNAGRKITKRSTAPSACFALMAVYKYLSASTGIIDTFLNDPPFGFKKDSLQFTPGANLYVALTCRSDLRF
jgi:hypothetical protein